MDIRQLTKKATLLKLEADKLQSEKKYREAFSKYLESIEDFKVVIKSNTTIKT